MGTVPRDPIFFPRMKFRAEKRIMRQHFDHVHWAAPPKYGIGQSKDPGPAFLRFAASMAAVAEALQSFADFNRTIPGHHESWKQ